MQVFHSLEQAHAAVEKTAVAIGNFDGVHQGHLSLLREMIATARRDRASATVLTFYPHPVEVLKPGTHLERLTTTAEKLALLESLSVDVVLVETFDKELSELTPEAFFRKYLQVGLRSSSLHVGFNFKFGKDRSGDSAILTALCEQAKIQLRMEKPFELGGTRVSSSLLRQLVRDGEIARAGLLLGRPFALSGQVGPGDQRGRTIGFPTANLRYSSEKVLPRTGVYLTRAVWQKQSFPAVTNIGFRPTFGAKGEERPLVEVHLLDFNARLYDEFLTLEFIERIRDEKKFDSVDALVKQIRADVDHARKTFGPMKKE